LFLGVYELCTKHAVRDNAVVPVLFFSTLTGAAVWVGLLMVQMLHPGTLPASLVTDTITPGQHLQLAQKPVIVAVAWVFTNFALNICRCRWDLSSARPVRYGLIGAFLCIGPHRCGSRLIRQVILEE
jgi:hypothetical protein